MASKLSIVAILILFSVSKVWSQNNLRFNLSRVSFCFEKPIFEKNKNITSIYELGAGTETSLFKNEIYLAVNPFIRISLNKYLNRKPNSYFNSGPRVGLEIQQNLTRFNPGNPSNTSRYLASSIGFQKNNDRSFYYSFDALCLYGQTGSGGWFPFPIASFKISFGFHINKSPIGFISKK